MVTGKRIGDILKENKAAPRSPRTSATSWSRRSGYASTWPRTKKDLHNKQAAPPRRVQDPPSREVLSREARAACRLGLQAGERRDPVVQVRHIIVPGCPCRLKTQQKPSRTRSAGRSSSRCSHTTTPMASQPGPSSATRCSGRHTVPAPDLRQEVTSTGLSRDAA